MNAQSPTDYQLTVFITVMKCSGNQSQAARILNVSRQNVSQIMQCIRREAQEHVRAMGDMQMEEIKISKTGQSRLVDHTAQRAARVMDKATAQDQTDEIPHRLRLHEPQGRLRADPSRGRNSPLVSVSQVLRQRELLDGRRRCLRHLRDHGRTTAHARCPDRFHPMKNLAGVAECDRNIRQELTRSMIQIVDIEPTRSEVPSRLNGRLGPFRFSRAWYYWCVYGPMPLTIAKELYADPVGAIDIRVAGHCGCPPPEAPWVNWYTHDGERIVETKQREEYEAMAKKFPGTFAGAQPICWHDDPVAINAHGYIDGYHIDSEVGLRLFCDAVRRHGLDKAERPTWWREK